MARASAKPGLRPYLPADAPTLAEIFRESVATLCQGDYDDDQLAAWASAAADEAAFAKNLAENLTIVALLDGSPCGFATLKEGKDFEMLYVHPAAAHRGVGAALAEAIEKLAHARGATEITVDASDSAREFFASRGYSAYRRNMVTIGGEWLANTTMRKKLGGASAPPERAR